MHADGLTLSDMDRLLTLVRDSYATPSYMMMNPMTYLQMKSRVPRNDDEIFTVDFGESLFDIEKSHRVTFKKIEVEQEPLTYSLTEQSIFLMID